jgi:hypothetical protein
MEHPLFLLVGGVIMASIFGTAYGIKEAFLYFGLAPHHLIFVPLGAMALVCAWLLGKLFIELVIER